MKTEERLKTFEPEILDLYNRIDGLELDEEYEVSGLEAKLKGIDILAIQDMWIKHIKHCSSIPYINMNLMPKYMSYTPCLVFKK